mmetsp:Transcript_28590/g.73586  ORF Transcript_28590/g.73586 Transcript_28590/m.73586 type:complete len:223 (-) Transcript_28590:39-707(-)
MLRRHHGLLLRPLRSQCLNSRSVLGLLGLARRLLLLRLRLRLRLRRCRRRLHLHGLLGRRRLLLSDRRSLLRRGGGGSGSGSGGGLLVRLLLLGRRGNAGPSERRRGQRRLLLGLLLVRLLGGGRARRRLLFRLRSRRGCSVHGLANVAQVRERLQDVRLLRVLVIQVLPEHRLLERVGKGLTAELADDRDRVGLCRLAVRGALRLALSSRTGIFRLGLSLL